MIGSTLKQLLAQRHMAVGELARRVDVPAQTLYSIIRRDNNTIDLEVLLRVCAALEVPVEVFCADVPGLPRAPGPSLSREEAALLDSLRALDAPGRSLIDTVLEHELDRVRADADTHLPPDSGLTLCCFGKVLLPHRPPLAL